VTQAPLAAALEKEVPEVELGTCLARERDELLRFDEAVSYEDGISADRNFFRMFSFPLVRGDADRALAEPDTIVLSERVARKIFGTVDPMGLTLNIGASEVRVTGICRDAPEDSHLRFGFVLPRLPSREERWTNNSFFTYVKLRPGASADAPLQEKIQAVIAAHAGEKEARARDYFLLPLTDIHFATGFNFGLEQTTDRRLVVLFSLIAAFILVLAGINYMNLATARFAQRSKEVGIRRVVGAERTQLVRQFLVESVFVSALAACSSLALLAAVLPAFGRWIGRSLSWRVLFEPGPAAAFAAAIVLTGLLAGSYPAVFLSSFRPGRTLKGSGGPASSGARVRNALVVFQFAISIVLLLATAVVARQIHFIQTKDLGYDREQVLIVPVRDQGIRTNLEAIKAELLHSTLVDGVSVGNTTMDTSGGSRSVGIGPGGEEIKNLCWFISVDHDFLKVFDVRLAQGRFFSPEHATDHEAVVINEAAARAFGWGDALGRDLSSARHFDKAKIVGVIKDYHFWSLHQKIEPAVLRLNPGRDQEGYDDWWPSHFSVKIQPGRAAAAVELVRKTYDAFKTLHPFQYEFLDDRFDRLYRSDRRFGTIFALFAGLSVFIACLGMFGLAAFTAEQKAREISIRKVLGATAASIAALLSRQFLRGVVAANVLAWPVAYLLMRTWTKDFYYRAPMSAGLFVLAGAAAAAFAFLAVSVQTAKAARTAPAERLRRE